VSAIHCNEAAGAVPAAARFFQIRHRSSSDSHGGPARLVLRWVSIKGKRFWKGNSEGGVRGGGHENRGLVWWAVCGGRCGSNKLARMAHVGRLIGAEQQLPANTRQVRQAPANRAHRGKRAKLKGPSLEGADANCNGSGATTSFAHGASAPPSPSFVCQICLSEVKLPPEDLASHGHTALCLAPLANGSPVF
jgi:hypothetical protein